MDETVQLDKESFKALAVDTRVNILKTLGQRRHTQSELAADLDMAVPTIKQHLTALVKADLVERHEEGRKWVYYALTKKGKAILNPEEKKFWIVLGVFVLTLGGAITGIVRQRFGNFYGLQEMSAAAAPVANDMAFEEMKAMAADSAVAEATRQATEIPASDIPWGWLILAVVFGVQLALLGYYWRKNRQHRKELLGAELNKKRHT